MWICLRLKHCDIWQLIGLPKIPLSYTINSTMLGYFIPYISSSSFLLAFGHVHSSHLLPKTEHQSQEIPLPSTYNPRSSTSLSHNFSKTDPNHAIFFFKSCMFPVDTTFMLNTFSNSKPSLSKIPHLWRPFFLISFRLNREYLHCFDYISLKTKPNLEIFLKNRIENKGLQLCS